MFFQHFIEVYCSTMMRLSQVHLHRLILVQPLLCLPSSHCIPFIPSKKKISAGPPFIHLLACESNGQYQVIVNVLNFYSE